MRRARAEESPSPASAFVKTLQFPHFKDDLSIPMNISSRGPEKHFAFPWYDKPRGLCRPNASPTSFRLVGAKRLTRSHGAPCSSGEPSNPFDRFVSPPTRSHVEIMLRARGLRFVTESELANARLSPLESEASSETGSSGGRAPVAAYSGPARAANDSVTGPGNAFFRVRLESD